MARTAEAILKETIGEMILNQSSLVSQVEALKDRVAQLEAKYEPTPTAPSQEPPQ